MAIVSIIGEGLFEVLGARAQGKVREFANTRVLIAQQEATNADIRAGHAILQTKSVAEDAKQLGGTSQNRAANHGACPEAGHPSGSALKKDLNRLDLDVKRRTARAALLSNADIAEDLRLSPFKR